MLAGGMLVMAFPAQSMAGTVRAVRVPCSTGALAAAIIAANASGGGVLRLARHCTYTITTPATAATGLPAVTGDVTLLGGSGTTIRRDPDTAALFRVFDVAAGARLRLGDISILNGRTTGLGGGIQNAGRLVLSHTSLSGNTAGNGGAVANLPGATATVSRSLISANATTGVGGGGILNSGSLIAVGTAFMLNTAPINGGAVNTQGSGTTRLTQSTVNRNISGGLGGGLSNLGTTVLNRTVVRFNRGSAGGGIATGNTNVLISRSVVRDNTPDNCSPLNTITGCSG
jgi:hypothetical protein